MLTTKTAKLVGAMVVAFLVWTPAAFAWSWPVQGPVLQPFLYDAAHPYASGQHRGIDIGADSAGEMVVAPSAGLISFAGTVPTSGKSVTIQTADGYSVTLTHLGSIVVAKGDTVAEQDAVGTVGPSGTAEEDVPYVHLGIRLTADPDGYLDPSTFLPPVATGDGADGSAPSQPSSTGNSSAAPAQKPTPATPAVPSTHDSTTALNRGRVSHGQDKRDQEPRTEVRTRPAAQPPAIHADEPATRTSHPAKTQQRHPAAPERFLRRPVVETAAPVEPAALGAGHELRPSAPATQRGTGTGLVPLLLNGIPALVALAAALAAARRRRHRLSEGAQVLHLPGPTAQQRPTQRAA
jgi:hypothetical protein